MTDREILERLFVTLALSDNDGDVLEAIERAAQLAGIQWPDDVSCLSDLYEPWEGKPGLWA